MGDEDRGATSGDVLETLEDALLRRRVQRACRLVCHQHARLAEKRTCDGDALFLAAAQFDAAFSDHGA